MPVRKFWYTLRLGLGVIDQLVPFHDSMRVPPLYQPAVSHDMDDTHEIPLRESPLPSLGLGVMLQLVPFHDSIRVPPSVPFTVMKAPTAMHDLDDTHETP